MNLLHPVTRLHQLKKRAHIYSMRHTDIFQYLCFLTYEMGMTTLLTSGELNIQVLETVTVLCDTVIKYKLALLQSSLCSPSPLI